MVDEESRRTHVISRILSLVHGDPDLGNKKDPVDELVYIILSRKTKERAYQSAFKALKARFPNWDQVMQSSQRVVQRLLFSSGLSIKKTRAILKALTKIQNEFGRCDMSAAMSWPDERLEAFLCALPEISRKSAFCVMMYSFNRKVFPVDTHVGRVLERLGIFHEAGLQLRGLDHKKKQEVLADLLPPDLRYFLHVNLVAHGRTICVGGRPHCNQCPLTKICWSYRHTVRTKEASRRAFRVADVFCGAGGLSAGLSLARFQRAKFRTVLAIDRDPVALRTFRLNHPEVPEQGLICADLRALGRKDLKRLAGLTALSPVDVLVAGPPCQGFSRVGRRSKKFMKYRPEKDEQNHLYREIGRLITALRPKVVIMENVPGMGEVKLDDGRTFIEAACSMLHRKGLQTTVWALNAAWYGVPQNRIRRVIIGSRLGTPPAPPPRRYHFQQDGKMRGIRSVISLMEAISDLPTLEAGEGHWIAAWVPPAAPTSQYLSREGILDSSGLLYSHLVRPQNDGDIARFRALRPGEGYKSLVIRCPWLKNYGSDTFTDKYYRLQPDKPCRSLVAHLQRDGNSFVHPFQVRSLSIRELARAQSFSDSYIFTGSRWDQCGQIGNSVPPLLAKAIGETVLQHLKSTLQCASKRQR